MGSEQDSFALTRNNEIRRLNDELRRNGTGGRTMITQGVAALPSSMMLDIVQAMQESDSFDTANDPHGEHDFGSIDAGGERAFWRIDYYDSELEAGSPDPADPAVTTRVLTIMLASEY